MIGCGFLSISCSSSSFSSCPRFQIPGWCLKASRLPQILLSSDSPTIVYTVPNTTRNTQHRTEKKTKQNLNPFFLNLKHRIGELRVMEGFDMWALNHRRFDSLSVCLSLSFSLFSDFNSFFLTSIRISLYISIFRSSANWLPVGRNSPLPRIYLYTTQRVKNGIRIDSLYLHSISVLCSFFPFFARKNCRMKRHKTPKKKKEKNRRRNLTMQRRKAGGKLFVLFVFFFFFKNKIWHYILGYCFPTPQKGTTLKFLQIFPHHPVPEILPVL